MRGVGDRVLDRDSKEALAETHTVLRDLAIFLIAVERRSDATADPSVRGFADQLNAVAAELEKVLGQATVSDESS